MHLASSKTKLYLEIEDFDEGYPSAETPGEPDNIGDILVPLLREWNSYRELVPLVQLIVGIIQLIVIGILIHFHHVSMPPLLLVIALINFIVPLVGFREMLCYYSINYELNYYLASLPLTILAYIGLAVNADALCASTLQHRVGLLLVALSWLLIFSQLALLYLVFTAVCLYVTYFYIVSPNYLKRALILYLIPAFVVMFLVFANNLVPAPERRANLIKKTNAGGIILYFKLEY